MLRLTTIFLSFTLFNLVGFAQKASEMPVEEDYECAKKHQYSFAERMKQYPFNVSEKVIIVSFDSLRPVETLKGMIPDEREIRIPIKDNKPEFELIRETFTLTNGQLEALTDILYNYDYKNDQGVRSRSQCFSPHHALVFFDGKNKMIAYVEVCFKCHNVEASNKDIKLGNFCSDKVNMLKDLFKKVGVKTAIE